MSGSSMRKVLYGTDEVIEDAIELRAGPLRMNLHHGKLWNVRLGEVEVWHGLGFVYRDVDWGTPESVIDHMESAVSEDRFSIRCRGHFPTLPAPLPFQVEIEGRGDGHIRFVAEATPSADVLTNRTGLCLMHPMSVGGSRVAVEHIDGRESHSTFPTLVPEWPPFMLVRGIRHEYAPDHWARCEFEGDVFEVEDQRNNSDASFKTYSRSNLMPRPYFLRAGATVRQSAELWAEGRNSAPAPVRVRPVTVRVGSGLQPLPKLGLEILPGEVRLGNAALDALRSLRASHLHLCIEGDASKVDWDGVGSLLHDTAAGLRIDLLLSDVAQAPMALDALQAQLIAAGIVAEAIAVFPSEQRCVDAARERFPHTRIGGGTPQFFVQLHRAERLGGMDFLSFTTSAIVHGTRDEEVMLTLQSLPSLIDTLRAKHAMPIRVGPSSIGARSSPLGRQPESDGSRRVALARQDPRCRGLFGAAWTLGYVAQFAKAGVESLTLMSLTGHSGVLADGLAATLVRYPAYFVLQRLCGDSRMHSVSVSQPARIAALALRRDSQTELLVANLTAESVEIELEGAKVDSVALMDAQVWPAFGAMSDPWTQLRRPAPSPRLSIGPYGVVSCLTAD